MGRIKTRKDYAIRLTHPELGEYYYHYTNDVWSDRKFFFTQNLSKVNTWKTLKYAEKQISTIKEKLDKKLGNKILLELGADIDPTSYPNSFLSRKKYYYPIGSVMSKTHIENAKNNLEKLDETLLADSKMITSLIKKSKHIGKDFMVIFEKMATDLYQYRKDYTFLEQNKNVEPIYLDIVDASYNFRLLKLRTLKTFQTEETETEENAI